MAEVFFNVSDFEATPSRFVYALKHYKQIRKGSSDIKGF